MSSIQNWPWLDTDVWINKDMKTIIIITLLYMYIQNLTGDMENIKMCLIKLLKMKTAKSKTKKNTMYCSIRSEMMVNLKKKQYNLRNKQKKYNFIYVSFLLLFKCSMRCIVYIKVKWVKTLQRLEVKKNKYITMWFLWYMHRSIL